MGELAILFSRVAFFNRMDFAARMSLALGAVVWIIAAIQWWFE